MRRRLDGQIYDRKNIFTSQLGVVVEQGGIPSLKSFPEQLLVTALICSNKTMRPASLAGSLSAGPLDSDLELLDGTKMSFKRGIIFSVNGRRPDGSNSIILKTFCRIKDNSSRSFISSRSAGRTFLSRTDFGNDGRTRESPRMNCAFSFGVLAGSESRNRIVEIKILSKYALCWNSFAVIR
jgi:hypothetical protein